MTVAAFLYAYWYTFIPLVLLLWVLAVTASD